MFALNSPAFSSGPRRKKPIVLFSV
uniref:Uncharacterized protein n=1 Tax=Anguilla anguilla TaxID=7936 RepID=A0A0E9VKD3_ANGAN